MTQMLSLLNRLLTIAVFSALFFVLFMLVFDHKPSWVNQQVVQSGQSYDVVVTSAFHPFDTETTHRIHILHAKRKLGDYVVDKAVDQIARSYGIDKKNEKKILEIRYFMNIYLHEFLKRAIIRRSYHEDVLAWKAYGLYGLETTAVDVWLQGVYEAYNAKILVEFEED